MMNELQIFNNPDFGEVRTLEENGTVLFSGNDVAKALGYSNPRDAVSRHCKGVVKRDGVSFTTNQHGVMTEQTVEMSFIPEGDVYRLIVRSKLPTAERFERWVFDEVLPSIRKTGGYTTAKAPQGKELLALAVLEAQKTIEAQNAEIARMKPKEVFADSVTASHTSILIGELAKLIKQNGVDMGQKRLFAWMRENGYLIKRQGTDWNMPTQRSMDKQLFEIKENSIANPDGSIRVTKTPKVTGKGQQYFINLFLAGAEV